MTVALAMGGLVLAGGVAIALLWKGAQPISAQPHASPDGKDVLHLTCDPNNCNDGTAVELDDVKSVFAAGASDLTLSQPLRVGDNALSLHVMRPGLGRDEIVKLVVPVAYRVHADVSTMNAARPSITVPAEALPGSDVRVDGKPKALNIPAELAEEVRKQIEMRRRFDSAAATICRLNLKRFLKEKETR